MLHGKLLPLENRRHDYYVTPEPRTAIALDKARKKMWWVVVDGRQPNYSEGMALSELTALLQQLGAYSAINMDGGGSSTMVLRRIGKIGIANSPIHTGIPGRERPVGNHLGIRMAASP
jgi:exopolysaccharide biosynthesis protein